MKIFTVVTTVILLGGFSIVLAAFNEQINYQGKLTDSSNQAVSDGNKCMRFSMYTLATDGSSIWSEEWKASTSYVTTTSGLFSVLLGSNTSLSSVNFNQSSLYLQVDYDPNCDATYDEVFSPRKRLGAVSAAFETKQLGGYTWATPDAIGSSTPNTGAFTTLSASSTLSISGLGTFSAVPSGTGVSQGSLYINPATATADYTLLGLAVGGTEKFRIDEDGDVAVGTWKASTIGVSYGGTGLASYATGDMLYASAATALSKLTIGSANYVLTSSGSAPQWSNTLTISGLTVSGLTSGRVTYATTGGQLTDSANLTFNGTTLTAGGFTTTGTLAAGTTNISGLATFSYTPQGTGVSQGSFYINPATATADYTLLGLAIGGTEKFRVDEDGDIVKVGNITMADSGWIGLGSSAGRISYTDATTDYVIISNGYLGIGTTGPDALLHLGETRTSGTIQKLSYPASTTLAGAVYGLDLDLSTNVTQGSNSILGLRMTLPSTGTADRIFSQFIEGSTTLYNLKTTVANIDVPVSFGSAGDVSISYDLQFTNDTASFIKSYGPLYIEAGDPNFNRDLTLRASGSGAVIVNDTFSAQNASNSTTAYQFLNASGTIVLDIDTTNQRVGIGTTTPDRLFHAELSDTATSDVSYLSRLTHITSATGDAGFGAGLEYELENASGTNRIASAIQSVWEDATNATEDASLRFLTIQNGTLAEAMRIDDNGYVGIGTTSPGRTLDVVGNWGGNAVVSNQTLTEATTVTISTKALVYRLTENSGTTEAPFNVTFNITGLPNTDGTFTFISVRAQKDATVGAHQIGVIIQINGTQVCSCYISGTTDAATASKNCAVARSDGAWRFIASTSGLDTASDIAEWFRFTGERPIEGEVVSIGDEPITVKKSTKAYDEKLVGIISTNPYIVMGPETTDSVKVALVGRVAVKVSTEAGPIEIGDYLTSSSQPGVAMKATKPGAVVAKALESFDGNKGETGRIEAFINAGWYGGELTEDGNLDNPEENTETEIAIEESFIQKIKRALSYLGLFIENGIAQAREFIAEKITARIIRAERIEMVDQRTGDVYCTWIEYGEMKKVRGECETIDIVEPEPLPEIQGCIDSQALNYNPEATIDNGSCEYPIEEISDTSDLSDIQPSLPEIPAVETTSPSTEGTE